MSGGAFGVKRFVPAYPGPTTTPQSAGADETAGHVLTSQDAVGVSVYQFATGPVSGVHRGVMTTPAPRGSGVIASPSSRQSLNSVSSADKPDSGVISLDSLTAAPTYSGSQSGRLGRGPDAASVTMSDPVAKLRQRITGIIITKFAAAGMYDLNALPIAELARIILAQVAEIVAAERLPYDDAGIRRLSAEIVASVKP